MPKHLSNKQKPLEAQQYDVDKIWKYLSTYINLHLYDSSDNKRHTGQQHSCGHSSQRTKIKILFFHWPPWRSNWNVSTETWRFLFGNQLYFDSDFDVNSCIYFLKHKEFFLKKESVECHTWTRHQRGPRSQNLHFGGTCFINRAS